MYTEAKLTISEKTHITEQNTHILYYSTRFTINETTSHLD